MEEAREFISNWAVAIGAILVAVIKLPEALPVLGRFYKWVKKTFLPDIYRKLHDHEQRVTKLEEDDSPKKKEETTA